VCACVCVWFKIDGLFQAIFYKGAVGYSSCGILCANWHWKWCSLGQLQLLQWLSTDKWVTGKFNFLYLLIMYHVFRTVNNVEMEYVNIMVYYLWIMSQIELNFFDPRSSSTSSLISCSDKRCNSGIQSSDATCSSQTNQCSYIFQYGDGSGTSGYYVSDTMHLDTIFEGSVSTNSSAPVVFGWALMSLIWLIFDSILFSSYLLV